MCEQMVGGHDLFEKMILVQPRECKLQPEIMKSKKAVLECGAVSHNDVSFFEDFACGRVQAFFDINNILFVEVGLMRQVGGDQRLGVAAAEGSKPEPEDFVFLTPPADSYYTGEKPQSE